jgi:hypothetical protein
VHTLPITSRTAGELEGAAVFSGHGVMVYRSAT